MPVSNLDFLKFNKPTKQKQTNPNQTKANKKEKKSLTEQQNTTSQNPQLELNMQQLYYLYYSFHFRLSS